MKVRKFELNIERLKLVLRKGKIDSGYSNKMISQFLSKPITLVEHWFRSDKCFSIPDDDVWLKLKSLLNIATDEFDNGILEFEYRDGVYEKSERCYYDYDIAPTITTVCADEKIIITNAFCVAMRGRYDEKVTIKQNLEPRFDGYTNTLTSVQKDNYVIEFKNQTK